MSVLRAWFTVFILFLSSICHSQLVWSPVNPSPTGNALFSIASGAGQFVGVGANGAIAASDDGKHWIHRESNTPSALTALIFANGEFLAAASDGTIVHSIDGIKWIPEATGATFPVDNLVFGNGTYVLAGGSANFLTSSDAKTWTPHTLPYNCLFNQTVNGGPDSGKIIFAHGRFVAAYEQCVLGSADGVNWTLFSFSNQAFWTLDFVNGNFIAVGGTSLAEVSPDGINWTAETGTNTYPLSAVCADGSSCIGLSSVVQQSDFISHSSDGSNWLAESIFYSLNGNYQSISSPPVLHATAFANGTYVAVGDFGILLYSTDGVDWMTGAFDLLDTLRGVTFGQGLFVAVGDRGEVQTSQDGVDWSIQARATSNDLYAIAYANGTYIAVGDGGCILSSSDGTNWAVQGSGTTANLLSVATNGAEFVAVGAGGTVLTSPDGFIWQSQNSGTAHALRALAYGANRYVAVGDFGDILESADGISWSLVLESDITTSLYSVAFGNGEFVALGPPYPLYSADGIHWGSAPFEFSATPPIIAMTFGDGIFITPDQSFTLADASGVSEVAGPGLSTTALTIRSIAVGASGAVAVGNSGVHLFWSGAGGWATMNSGLPYLNSRITAVAADGPDVLAVGSSFSNTSALDLALISHDRGTTWSALDTGQLGSVPLGLASHDGAFVTVTEAGSALIYNGSTWNKYDIGIGQYVTRVQWVNDRYIALGNSGSFASSIDGVVWNAQSLSTYSVNDVAFGNGNFVIAGSDIYYSGDGQSWQHAYSAGGNVFNAVAFGRGQFAAVGNAGVAVSNDGLQWSDVCPANSLSSLIYDGTKFVGVGASDSYVTFNGKEWRRGLLHTPGPTYGVAYSSGKFVTGSEFGTIQTSFDDLVFSSEFEGVSCPL